MNLENPIPAVPGKVKSAPRDEGPRGPAGAAVMAAQRGGGSASDEPGAGCLCVHTNMGKLREGLDMGNEIKRGQVHYALLEPALGCEQGGRRPVIVVSNDKGNRYGRTLVVVPVTTGNKPALPTHVWIGGEAGLREHSIALCEQVRSIDRCRLLRPLGELGASSMALVEASLEVALGLSGDSELIVLCKACAEDFRDSGAFSLRRTDPHGVPCEMCTVCSAKRGVEYVLTTTRDAR